MPLLHKNLLEPEEEEPGILAKQKRKTPRVPTETQEPLGNSPMEATVTQEPMQH